MKSLLFSVQLQASGRGSINGVHEALPVSSEDGVDLDNMMVKICCKEETASIICSCPDLRSRRRAEKQVNELHMFTYKFASVGFVANVL